jgi:hypothetical protein
MSLITLTKLLVFLRIIVVDFNFEFHVFLGRPGANIIFSVIRSDTSDQFSYKYYLILRQLLREIDDRQTLITDFSN